MVSEGERSSSARGTEALQSCFCRPGLHSMTTGRLEIDLPSSRRWLWRLPPSLRRGHPCPREGKSGEKIEEVISRPFVCYEGCDGNPGRAGCDLPGALKLPWPAFLTTWGSEVRAGHETRITAFTHRARQASATKSWRSYRVLRPAGGQKGRPGCRARGAFVLSKRAARDARALRADELRPKPREGASFSQIRCLHGRSPPLPPPSHCFSAR